MHILIDNIMFLITLTAVISCKNFHANFPVISVMYSLVGIPSLPKNGHSIRWTTRPLM